MSKLAKNTLLLIVASVSMLAVAVDKPIDVKRSTIRIHVGKAGAFSAAGHEHWVAAPITSGSLDPSPPHISFRVESSKLQVEPDKDVSAEKQAEVQHTMQTQVLESDKFPEIAFQSTAVQQMSPETWDVTGNLTLHGQTHPVRTTVRKEQDAYVGRCQLKQTDFGIRPVRVAGGVVKVKDQLDIDFSVVPSE